MLRAPHHGLLAPLLATGLVPTAIAVASPATVPAFAAPDDRLAWSAPEGCPTEDELRGRIEARLGTPLPDGFAPLDIAVVKMRGRFVATLDATAIAGTANVRTLHSARCDELVDAVALVVARIVSDRARSEQAPPAPVDDAAPESERAAPPAKEVAAVEDRDDPLPSPAVRAEILAPLSPPTTWGASMRMSLLSGVGGLPLANAGAELAVQVHARGRFVEVSGSKWLAQSTGPQDGEAVVEVGLLAVNARAGTALGALPFRVWVMGEVGRLEGTGMRVTEARSGSARHIAVGAGGAVTYPVNRHARLTGGLELVVPIERPKFTLESGAELYQPGVAGVRGAVGIEIGWR